MVVQLLKEDGEPYVLLGRNVKGLLMKALYMIRNDVKLLLIASKFKPDLFVSMSSPYSAHVSFLMRRPHISFTDTEISKIILFLLIPFTDTMITPSSFKGEFRFRNHVRVDSYKELAYLHPKYFKPDEKVLEMAGIKPSEKFIVVRFSAYDASHDVGLRGLTDNLKKILLQELTKIARTLVTSEVLLHNDIEKFRLRISPSKMHDLLSYASLYIGEGAVMASEASLLGIPSIFINPSNRGYIDELEKNGLLIHYSCPEKEMDMIIDTCKRIISDDKILNQQKRKSREYVMKKDDMTRRILEIIDGKRIKKEANNWISLKYK